MEEMARRLFRLKDSFVWTIPAAEGGHQSRLAGGTSLSNDARGTDPGCKVDHEIRLHFDRRPPPSTLADAGGSRAAAGVQPPTPLSPRILPLRDSRNRFSNYLLLPSCAYCQKRVRTGLEGAWAPPPRTGGAGSRPIPWRRRSSGCARYRVRGRREGSREGCRYDGGVGAKSVGQRIGGRDFEGQRGGRREEGFQRPTRHKTARTTTMAKSKTAHRMKNQPQNPLPSPAGGLAGSLDVGG